MTKKWLMNWNSYFMILSTVCCRTEKDIIISLLPIVLDSNRAPHLDLFLSFLETTTHQRITLDQWDSFLQFNHAVKVDLSNHDDNGACKTNLWPIYELFNLWLFANVYFTKYMHIYTFHFMLHLYFTLIYACQKNVLCMQGLSYWTNTLSGGGLIRQALHLPVVIVLPPLLLAKSN